MGSKKRRSFTNKYGDPSLTGGEESPARPSAGGRRSEDYIPDENDWVSRAYVPPSNDDGCCCINPFCCLTNSSGMDEEEGNNKSSSKCNGCGPCTSYTSKSVAAVMMIGLIVLAALGIGLMVFGAMEQVKPVVKLCATCNGITVASLVAGGIAILLLFIGVIALYRMNRILSVIFSVLMLLICAMFLAVFIAVLVFRYDRDASVMSGFEDMWTDAVRHDPSLACTVQSDLSCSGFRSGCCYTNHTALNSSSEMAQYCFVTLVNGTTVSADGDVLTWPQNECPRDCVVHSTQTLTCGASLRDHVQTYLVPVTVVLGILSLLVAVLSYIVPRIVFSKPAEVKKVRVMEDEIVIGGDEGTISSHSLQRTNRRRARSPNGEERSGLLVLTDN